MTTKDKIQKNKKTLQGIVVGTSMTDTAKVAVSRYVKHPKYKKFIKKVKNFLVHDVGNTAKIGDKVQIEECKPISKTKHFILKNSK
jgi:small subunit ribosomal protein S17